MRHWAAVIAVAVGYVASGLLGLRLQPLSGFATLVWAPTGIAVAAVVLGGPRMWPAIAIGAWVTNAVQGAEPWTAAGIAVGNTLEAVVAYAVLRRAGFERGLDRLRDVVVLVVPVALFSTMVSATIGLASVYAAGRVAPGTAGPTWVAWWLGDMLGALTVAPLCLVWSAWPRRWSFARALEAVVLVVTAVAGILLVFEVWRLAWLERFPKTYLLFPLQLWAALRFRQHGVVLLAFAAAALAIALTVQRTGPFVDSDVAGSLLHLQSYLAVFAITGMVMAAVESERRRVQLDQTRARERLGERVVKRTRTLREAIDELRSSQSRLEEAQRLAALGSWEWEIAADRVRWSEELSRIYGVPGGERDTSYAAFLAHVHPDDSALFDDQVQVAQAHADRFAFEHRIVRPDGSERTVHARGEVVRDDDGAPVRLLGTGQDVTDAKHAERAIRRAYDEMDLRVRERTAELTAANAALHRENAERERLAGELRRRIEQLAVNDRRKDEFLAMLAHELRNPLAAVTTALGVLATSDLPPAPRQHALEVAQRQLRHLAALIDDLLDISRLTRGRIALRRERVDLRVLIERAVEAARPAIDRARHRLRITHAPPGTALDADPTRCEQILVNLLHNAAKYTPAGGEIEIRASVDGEHAVVCVRDNGIGMDPELLASVFDLFVQADRSLDRTQGGLGIGLTMVQRLAELHGGSVAARSDGPGRGSAFEVRLPRAKEAPRAAPDETPAPPPPERPLSVLVVDDNADLAAGTRMMLESWGHRVVVAHDAERGLALARTAGLDVVLLDIGLPGLDGYEVARRIRAAAPAGNHRIRLVAMTGYGRTDDRRRAFAAGFDAHLLKPFDTAQLRSALFAPSSEAAPARGDAAGQPHDA